LVVLRLSRIQHALAEEPNKNVFMTGSFHASVYAVSTPQLPVSVWPKYIGQIDMLCARTQWVRIGYWCNSEGLVYPDPVCLRTRHVESVYLSTRWQSLLFNSPLTLWKFGPAWQMTTQQTH